MFWKNMCLSASIPPSQKITCLLSPLPAWSSFSELSGDAVLILPHIKLNLQFSCCAFYFKSAVF